MAYTKVAPSKSSGASIVYARDGKENGKDKCVAMSGLNCDPSNAEYEFAVVRHAYGKALREGEDIQARLMIQSFEGRDVSADEVNEMGYELAERINERLGGGFQAVVYTHGNTGNFHNHIVFNSVNADNGRKYTMHFEKFEIEKMSDEIVLSRGLPVIEKQKEDITTRGEMQLRERGQYVWKDDLKERFNGAIDKTLSNVSKGKAEYLEDFKKNMSDLGVTVKERYVKKRDTTYFTYAFTDENGKKQTASEKKLGIKYSAERVSEAAEERLEQNKAETLETAKEAISGPERPLRKSGFVPPAEIERKRDASKKPNKPSDGTEIKKETQTAREMLTPLEMAPRPLRRDDEDDVKKRIREKVLESFGQRLALKPDGSYREMVLYCEETQRAMLYRVTPAQISQLERYGSNDLVTESFDYRLYTAPDRELMSGRYEKHRPESFYEQLKGNAQEKGVSSQFELGHRTAVQQNRNAGRSR